MFEIFKQGSQQLKRQWVQTIADYWPVIPIALIIVITASALVGPTPQPL
jgi:hypothetical protein